MAQEVDVQKVVNKLLQVIGDLQLKNAMLEAKLESMVESSKGGEEGGNE